VPLRAVARVPARGQVVQQIQPWEQMSYGVCRADSASKLAFPQCAPAETQGGPFSEIAIPREESILKLASPRYFADSYWSRRLGDLLSYVC
jgi:hypothetical protein